jgi:hypothetical protein
MRDNRGGVKIWVVWMSAIVLAVRPFTSIAGRTRAPQARAPQATVRELATIDGDAQSSFRLPNGRILLYNVGDTTFTYDIVTRHRTVLATDMHVKDVSPQGDRLAVWRSADEQKEITAWWTMPIDPKTGLASGPGTRMPESTVQSGGHWAKFSPDGKTLGYSAGPLSDGTFNLTLAPAAGGPGRVVANYPRSYGWGWSRDGESLYVDTGDWFIRVERVPVTGGRTDLLFPYTARADGKVVGLSADARVTLFTRNPDRFFYRTVSGVTGEIEVALPAHDDGYGFDWGLDSRMRYDTMTRSFDRRVYVLDPATGQVRDLLPHDVQSCAPAWSPDGRRLAVRTGNASHYDIAVVNADASGLRRYPLSPEMSGRQMFWRPVEMRWSPDGRLLAFEAGLGKLALLDVRSGQTRALTTTRDFVWRSDGTAVIGDFVWRADGQAIRAIKSPVVATGPRTMGIVEIDLSGAERLLRDIAREFPWATGARMISDGVATVDDGHGRIVAVPIQGAAQQVSRPLADAGDQVAYAGHSSDGHWAFGKIVTRSPATDLLIMSTTHDATRRVHLPVESGNNGVPCTQTGNTSSSSGGSRRSRESRS